MTDTQMTEVVQETAPYITALIIFGVFLLMAALWKFVLGPLLVRIAKHTKHEWDNILVFAFIPPVSALLVLLGGYAALGVLPFAQAAYTGGLAMRLLRSIMLVLLGWGLIRARGIVQTMLAGAESKMSFKTSNALTGFFTKLFVVLVAIFVACMVLSEFNFNITGLLTGLGLGSLTFALAAQDAASNFFAGMIIIVERPFETGDWITTDTVEGTVEDVSFRTTKVRTFANALVIVPNSKLSGSAVTNWTRLKMRQGLFTLRLPYSTPKATLQAVCADITAMLKTHPDVREETVQVRLDKFNDSSIDIFVLFYTKTADIAEFRRVKEDINLKIMDIMAKNNASFAFPSRSIYMENMPHQ